MPPADPPVPGTPDTLEPPVTEPPADRAQLRDIGIQFWRHGITARPDRLLLLTDHAGHPVGSSTELTRTEAAALLQRLQRLPIGALPTAVARRLTAAPADTPSASRGVGDGPRAGPPDSLTGWRPSPRRMSPFLWTRSTPTRVTRAAVTWT
jgi:hypothetical protein